MKSLKLALLLFPSIALAHHGQDFFVTLDTETPDVFSANVFGSFEWSKRGSENEIRYEQGFQYGIAPGLAIGAVVGVENSDDGGIQYAGVSPLIQYQIPTGDFPVSFSIAVSHSFANENASNHDHGNHDHGNHDHGNHDHGNHDHDDTDHSDTDHSDTDHSDTDHSDTDHSDTDHSDTDHSDTDHSDTDHSDTDHSDTDHDDTDGTDHAHPDVTPPTGGGFIDLGPDAPTKSLTRRSKQKKSIRSASSSTSDSHDGIHRHGESYTQVRWIASTKLTPKTHFVSNFIMVMPDSGGLDLGYSLGLRQKLNQTISLGLEATGDLVEHGEHEIITGLYYYPTHHCALRLGVGTGIGSLGNDFSLHTGLTWQF